MLEPCIPIDEGLRLKTLQGLSILDTPTEERFDRLQFLFETHIDMLEIIKDKHADVYV